MEPMRNALPLALVLSIAASLPGQSTLSPAEAHAAQAFDAARRAGPLALHAFLEKMPKGAEGAWDA